MYILYSIILFIIIHSIIIVVCIIISAAECCLFYILYILWWKCIKIQKRILLIILNTGGDRGKERGEKRRKEGKGVGKRWRRIKGKMYLAHIRYKYTAFVYIFPS